MLRQPIPHFKQLVGGLVLVVVGLAFFLIGLELVDPVVAAIETAGRLDEHGTGVVFVLAVERGAGIEAEPSEQASAKGSVTGPSYSHNAGRAW